MKSELMQMGRKKKKKKKKKKNRLFGSNIYGTLLTISVNIHCEPGRLLLRPYIVAAITGAISVRI